MRRGLKWLLVALAVGAIAALAARAMGFRPVRITSGSMAPTIARGDWIVVRDLDDLDPVRRGDVVLFRFPLGSSGRAVKRVVAVGGDRVTISARRLIINGRAMPLDGAPSESAARRRTETVGPGDTFLLGDNAAGSVDSRSFGAVPRSELVGRDVLVLGGPGRLLAVAGGALVLLAALLTVARARRPEHRP